MPRWTTLAIVAIGFLVASCGQAGAVRGRHDRRPHPAIQAATPSVLIAQILSNLDTSTIASAEISSAPTGSSGDWLYVKVTQSSGAGGVLPDFNALLLTGAYSVSAPNSDLLIPESVEYYDGTETGCATTDATACDATSWRVNVAPVPYSPTTDDSAALTGRIDAGLKAAGLEPVSVTFERPLASLVPIVVARTDGPASAYQGDQWQAVRETVFGPDTGYEGDYLEIVDSSGLPVAITAVETDLGIGLSWTG